MAYEPKTEAGKEAIAAGADPSVIEQQEADGELVDETNLPEEHIERPAKTPEEVAAEAEAARVAAGDGEGDEAKGPDRTVQHIPAWKHKEELKKLESTLREEFQGELQQA